MPKKKRRKKKPSKSNKSRSNIPESASTTRFLIFLAIGFVLLAVFLYFSFKMGFSNLEDELSEGKGLKPTTSAEGETSPSPSGP
jgi:hypothetical protein